MPESPPDRAAAIYASLLAEGEVVDTGGFSIDLEAAAAKRRAFQYGDRRIYLVPFAECVACMGSKLITFARRGEDLQARAVDVTFDDPVTYLSQIRAYAGVSTAPYPIQRLAVAIDMACGIENIERVFIEYDAEDQRIVVEVPAVGEPQLRRLEPRRPAPSKPSLEFVVDRPWHARVALHGPARLELEHIERAVAASSLTIEIDGRCVSKQGEGLWFPEAIEREGFTVLAGYVADDDFPPSAVEYFVGSIKVDEAPLPGRMFRARVALVEPPRDLSAIKVAVDRLPEGLDDAIEQARHACQAELESARKYWGNNDRSIPEGWSREHTRMALGEDAPLPDVTRRFRGPSSLEDLFEDFLITTLGCMVLGLSVGFMAHGDWEGIITALMALMLLGVDARTKQADHRYWIGTGCVSLAIAGIVFAALRMGWM